jgi:hypothetical protein
MYKKGTALTDARAQKECVEVHGFFRVKIGERKNGRLRVVGNSGWQKNQVVNLGFQDYICGAVGAIAGSKQIGYMGIGTGTAPNASHTTLDGETGTRKATSNSCVSSQTMQVTAAWASTDHPGGTPNVRNLGMFNTSSAGTLCCGNTFNSSAWNSNQAISVTYQLRFS